ncbi:hypothetical protein CALVIDRAFT_541410, partial [Calocera viscosa TUFC12733]
MEIQQLASLSCSLTHLTLRVCQLDSGSFNIIATMFSSLIELDIQVLWDDIIEPQAGPAFSDESAMITCLWARLSAALVALRHCRKFAYIWYYSEHGHVPRTWEGCKAGPFEPEYQWITWALHAHGRLVYSIPFLGWDFVRREGNDWNVYRRGEDTQLAIGGKTEVEFVGADEG